MEERLTELTKSINDNIAIFTDVQKRSQKEINDVKAKVASLEDSEGYKQDLKALKEVVKEIQTSVKSKEKDMEALRSTIQTMESDVYTEVKELVSLKQEQQRFKEAADSEHHTLQALTEKILRAEESAAHLPEEIRRLEEELGQLKAAALRPEEDGAFRPSEAFETLQKESQGLDSRLQSVEDGVQAARAASARQGESLRRCALRAKNRRGAWRSCRSAWPAWAPTLMPRAAWQARCVALARPSSHWPVTWTS